MYRKNHCMDKIWSYPQIQIFPGDLECIAVDKGRLLYTVLEEFIGLCSPLRNKEGLGNRRWFCFCFFCMFPEYSIYKAFRVCCPINSHIT